MPAPGIGELLMRQSGNAINAATILIVAVLLIWFGLRPATKALLVNPAISAQSTAVDLLPTQDFTSISQPAPAEAAPPQIASAETAWAGEEPDLIEDFSTKNRRSPQKPLEQMVSFDEEQAAAILKQWLYRKEWA